MVSVCALGLIAGFLTISSLQPKITIGFTSSKIFEDANVGKEARRIFDDAQKLLKRIIDGRLLRAHAVYGFFPANSVGDDIVIWTDETRRDATMTDEPMTDEEMETKFRRCASLRIAPDRVSAASEAIWNLDKLADL